MTARIIKPVLAACLSLTMLASFAACGTTDDAATGGSSRGSASTSSDAQGYDTSSVKKDDELAALLPESITKDGKFTIGVETTYAPAEFLAQDGKTAIGFDIDLAKALAATFGLEEESVSAPFDSIIPAVGTKYDVGLSSFTVTPERIEAVDFVSYFNAGSTFVVQKGNPKNVDTDNLCGVSVGVQIGTVQEEEMNKAKAQCEADGKKPVEVQASKLQTDITTAVVTGKAAAFYADTPVAGYAVKQTGDKLQTIGENKGAVPEAIAIKKGDSKTVEAIHKAVQKLIDDGTYKKILDYWGVADGAVKQAEVNPKVE